MRREGRVGAAARGGCYGRCGEGEGEGEVKVSRWQWEDRWWVGTSCPRGTSFRRRAEGRNRVWRSTTNERPLLRLLTLLTGCNNTRRMASLPACANTSCPLHTASNSVVLRSRPWCRGPRHGSASYPRLIARNLLHPLASSKSNSILLVDIALSGA